MNKFVSGLVAFLLGFTVVWAILGTMKASYGHDHEKPELGQWFTHLHSGKGLCCDGDEAVHLSDVEWDVKDGHYRVKVPATREMYAKARKGLPVEDTIWVEVQDDAVIKEPNEDGQPLVWPVYSSINGSELTVWIRCFIPGSGT